MRRWDDAATLFALVMCILMVGIGAFAARYLEAHLHRRPQAGIVAGR
jgi:uncharacterized membrane protein YgdD (TMEM256/DUF423 family)